MSGPVLRGHQGNIQVTDAGTYDGIAVTVRPDLMGREVIAPPLTGCGSSIIYDWMREGCHMIGDFQFGGYYFLGGPNGDLGVTPPFDAMVLQFSKPIRRVRVTMHYGSITGITMAAVEQATGVHVDGTYVPLAEVEWLPNTDGTRTITSEQPFSFLVIRSNGPEGHGYLQFGATFKDMYFYETLPALAVQTPIPDTRVPRGAGRLLSFHWPRYINSGASIAAQIYTRPMNMYGPQQMQQSTIGSPPAGTGTIDYRGMRCARITAGNGTGTVFAPQVGAGKYCQIYPAIQRMTTANLDGLDEIACWRFQALLAFEQPAGPITRECGLCIGPGNYTQVRGSVFAGISLSLADYNTLVLWTRPLDNAAGLQSVLPLPAGFDIADWHNYELRIVSATSTSEAKLKVLIDEIEVLVLSWGAGTFLPEPHVGTVYGFFPSITNIGGSAAFTTRLYIAHGGVEIAAAMTEDALL